MSENGDHMSHARKAVWAVLTAGALWLTAKAGSKTQEVYGLPPRVDRLEKHLTGEEAAHAETNRMLHELLGRVPEKGKR